MKQLRHIYQVYGAVLALAPKFFPAYRAWGWAEFIVQFLSMTILVFFWRAVYANGGALSGMTLQQTLNYILIAQGLMPLVENRLIFSFGFMLRDGQIAMGLLRPMDFQLRHYVEGFGSLILNLLFKTPLSVVAVPLFGLQLPSDPGVWLGLHHRFDPGPCGVIFLRLDFWVVSR